MIYNYLAYYYILILLNIKAIFYQLTSKNMKKQLFTMATLSFLILSACQPTTPPAAEQPASDAPDYAAFDSKVQVIKAFIKAYSDEDVDAMTTMLADTMRWSPAVYNGNEWLGKTDYLAALQEYHQAFDNIQFHEGIAGLDNAVGASIAYWSGSVFPESTATIDPDIIRVYGTWTANHTETGKDIGAKWYGLVWVNEAGQIAAFADYFDAHGLAAQVAEE